MRKTIYVAIILSVMLLTFPNVSEIYEYNTKFLDPQNNEITTNLRIAHGTRAINVYAVQTGNWNDTATWNTGAIPGSGDEIQINGTYTVYIRNNQSFKSIHLEGQLIIDAVGNNSDITVTIDDVSGAGFGTSKGNLTTNGSKEYNITIRSAGSPGPSNYWDGWFNSNMTFDNTTFEGMTGIICYTYAKINNCTFRDYQGRGFHAWTGITFKQFNNVYIDHGGKTSDWGFMITTNCQEVFQNVTIVNVGSGAKSVYLNSVIAPGKFLNSSFDESKVEFVSNYGNFVSKNHNKTIGNYIIGVGTTLSKSTIPDQINYGPNDNVTIFPATPGDMFQANEESRHNNLFVTKGAEYYIDTNCPRDITGAGYTFSVDSTSILDIDGQLNDEMEFKSSVNGQEFYFNISDGATVQLDYLEVEDCNASLGETAITDDSSIDVGNNTNWYWGNISYIVNGIQKFCDYDPQVFHNSNGETMVIVGVGTTGNRSIFAYYSTDTINWTEVVLFSNITNNDGIIDNDTGGYWEFSGEVYNDVLYVAYELHISETYRSAFSKCDISNITNVGNYTNWQSANGTPALTEGDGSDGYGYDLLESGYYDPTIAVQSPNNILVGLVRPSVPPRDFFVERWNGTSWSTPALAKNLTENISAVACLRHTQEGHWVAGLLIDATDTNDYIIVVKCNSTEDPLNESNWLSMNGTQSFDYVIDTGAGPFLWPNVQVDANNNVHVISFTNYNIDSYLRPFHNWWNGTAWVNGSLENNAGARIQNGTSDPALVSGSPRYLEVNADAGGNIIIAMNIVYPASASGLYTMMWNGSWLANSYIRHGQLVYLVCAQGYMRENQTKAPFLLAGQTRLGLSILLVDSMVPGQVWWENYTVDGGPGTSLYNISLYKDVWNFNGYPNSTTIYPEILINEVPNCTAIVGKNITTGYWYTYWPSLGLNENWTIKFGDGLFFLVDVNVTWQVQNHTQSTSITKDVWNPMVYTGTTETNTTAIFSTISNCTAIVGKNITTGYWYTYWPSLGLTENWDIKFGDGLFILTDQDSNWDHT